MTLGPSVTPLTKSSLKWIRDLNVRPETIKLRRKHEKNLPDMVLGNNFLDMTPKAQTIK